MLSGDVTGEGIESPFLLTCSDKCNSSLASPNELLHATMHYSRELKTIGISLKVCMVCIWQ